MKKSDWNSIIHKGNGACHNCSGSGKDISHRSEVRCHLCKGSGTCSFCMGTGVDRFGWHCSMCMNNFDSCHKKYYQEKGRHAEVDEVLEKISDEFVARIIGYKCDSARECLALNKNTASSFNEFISIIAENVATYLKKINFSFCGGTPEKEAETALHKIYPDIKVPYKCAVTGEAGGIKGILDEVNEYAKTQLIKNWRENSLEYFEIPERLRLLKEYVKKYGHLLPAEDSGISPETLVVKFKSIMLRHVTEIAPGLRSMFEKG